MQVGGRGPLTRGSPFQRDFRMKSMFRDGALYAQWMERCEEFGIEVRTIEVILTHLSVKACCCHLKSPSTHFTCSTRSILTQESEENNGVPEFEGDASQSQRSRSPSPVPKEREEVDGEKENGEHYCTVHNCCHSCCYSSCYDYCGLSVFMSVTNWPPPLHLSAALVFM